MDTGDEAYPVSFFHIKEPLEVDKMVEKTIRTTKMAIMFIFLCSSSYIVTALMLNEPAFLSFASIGYAMCLSLWYELKTLKRLYVKYKE